MIYYISNVSVNLTVFCLFSSKKELVILNVKKCTNVKYGYLRSHFPAFLIKPTKNMLFFKVLKFEIPTNNSFCNLVRQYKRFVEPSKV